MDWFLGWGCLVDVEFLFWDGLFLMWVLLMSVGFGGGVFIGFLVDGFWVLIFWFGLFLILVKLVGVGDGWGVDFDLVFGGLLILSWGEVVVLIILEDLIVFNSFLIVFLGWEFDFFLRFFLGFFIWLFLVLSKVNCFFKFVKIFLNVCFCNLFWVFFSNSCIFLILFFNFFWVFIIFY